MSWQTLLSRARSSLGIRDKKLVREQLRELEGEAVTVKIAARDHSCGVMVVGELRRACIDNNDWWQTSSSDEEQPYHSGAAFHVDCVKEVDLGLKCIRLRCV